MNRFRTFGNSMGLAGVAVGLFLLLTFGGTYKACAQSAKASVLSESNGPLLSKGSYLYADIDTLRQRIFVLLKSGLWKFDLNEKSWSFLDSLQNRPKNMPDFEFGYNAAKNKLQFWSRGLGKVYSVSLSDYSIQRTDRSFDHKNQFFHYPFFNNNGTLFTFGGYGLWEWQNKLTFYNERIREWNLQAVQPTSPMPESRSPYAGAYNSKADELYIYGGIHPKDNRQDDQFTVKQPLHDLWIYNFDKKRWNNLGKYDSDSLQFFSASILQEIGPVNKNSGSVFSPDSNLWYLPFIHTGQSRDILYFKPINIQNGQGYEPMKINFGGSKQFLPANFFYSPQNNKLIFAGLDYVTNSTKYPIRIYSLDEDSLLQVITAQQGKISATLVWSASIGVVLLLLIGGYLFAKNRRTISDRGKAFSLLRLQNYDWLTKEEKKLLSHLKKKDSFIDTHEIEDLLWPDIDNYDYRRRLRNDIIKSINKKVHTNSSAEEKLIITKTDPTDRRKNLYGINSSFR